MSNEKEPSSADHFNAACELLAGVERQYPNEAFFIRGAGMGAPYGDKGQYRPVNATPFIQYDEFRQIAEGLMEDAPNGMPKRDLKNKFDQTLEGFRKVCIASDPDAVLQVFGDLQAIARDRYHKELDYEKQHGGENGVASIVHTRINEAKEHIGQWAAKAKVMAKD